MKVKADAFGIEITELLMEKFDVCVDVIVAHDNERASTKEP